MMLNEHWYLGGKGSIFRVLLTFFSKDVSYEYLQTLDRYNKILPHCKIVLSCSLIAVRLLEKKFSTAVRKNKALWISVSNVSAIT